MAALLDVAIVGAGPAGLSAAARAARRGLAHLLIDKAGHCCDTIVSTYARGKLVMEHPLSLPLRSDLRFAEGPREDVLDTFQQGLPGVATRFGVEVVAIGGRLDQFRVQLSNGEVISARRVVLAIGVQGNANRLAIPGADWPNLHETLRDPQAFEGERIVVIGTGDSGLETALALRGHNQVTLVNTSTDFPRAKPANVNAIQAAIADRRADRRIEHLTRCRPTAIAPGRLVLAGPEGPVTVACDRIFARIGARPPRAFLERCGIAFPSADPNALPILDEAFETSVPGLHVIGALAGYPLIKTCLNQGYDLIERIAGHPVVPVDEELIQRKLRAQSLDVSVSELLALARKRFPPLGVLSLPQMRDVMLGARIESLGRNAAVFRQGDFTDQVWFVLNGQVDLRWTAGGHARTTSLQSGDFFGELAFLTGRSAHCDAIVRDFAVVLAVERNAMIRLMRSAPAIHRMIEEAGLARMLRTYLLDGASEALVDRFVAAAELVSFRAGEVLIRQGDRDDCLYLLRSGSVMVAQNRDGRDIVLAYVQSGKLVGEMALLTAQPRGATVTAAVATEAIRLPAAPIRQAMQQDPELRYRLEEVVLERSLTGGRKGLDDRAQAIKRGFAQEAGAIEAVDVLVIDESLCIRCDNCETACAETHGGISRLDREAGPTFADIHVPTSCRHCEHPHCMADCPPDALSRGPGGEVLISDACIGCGNCERNCPYGVITMAHAVPHKPGLWQWLLFGRGPGPGGTASRNGHAQVQGGRTVAVKCDMCSGLAGGAACVRACPTGAAIRITPGQLMDLVDGA